MAIGKLSQENAFITYGFHKFTTHNSIHTPNTAQNPHVKELSY